MQFRFFKRGLPIIAFALFVLFNGCKDSPTTSDGGQVSFTVRYVSTPRTTILAKASAVMAVDSLRITRARVVVNNIDFEGGDEDSENDDMEFSTAPMVVELNLADSIQTLIAANVPFGSYSEIEIEIKAPDDSALAALSPADRAAFADFVAGPRYSVIIEGVQYQNGATTPQPFVFSSAIYAEQESELNPPLVVSADNPMTNITMAVYSAVWFVGPGGALLDPTDPGNKTTIAQNIKQSIELYKDDDQDGDDDDDDDGDD